MTETKAIFYARVSTDDQARHGYSLNDQRRVLREHARREGYEVVEEVADEGDSGANPYRAGLLKIRELAEAGAMDLVLATKLNRFFRDLYYRRGFERDLKRLGVSLVALDDTGNRIADGVMDLLGEEQRAEIARETRRGRMQRARSGEVVAGTAPYGFRFTPDRKTFEVEESEALIIRKIFRMAADGVGLNGIASALMAGGVPTPRGQRGAKVSGDGRTWSRAVLRQMVLSDCYLPTPRTICGRSSRAATSTGRSSRASTPRRSTGCGGSTGRAWRPITRTARGAGGSGRTRAPSGSPCPSPTRASQGAGAGAKTPGPGQPGTLERR